MEPHEHLGWFSRDYLPHFDRPGWVQAITFRLADSLPGEKIQRWKAELAHETDAVQNVELRRRIEAWIDAGHGACWLRDESMAGIVENAFIHFDGQRYRLLAWTIMPNHVHLLIETKDDWPLSGIIQSWKTWTAKQINAHLQRAGTVWQREYHDRFIRDGDHLANVLRYIHDNPVKAGLCSSPEDWRWGSARRNWTHGCALGTVGSSPRSAGL